MVTNWSAWSWYNLHVSILKRESLIKLLHSAWSLKLSGENKNSRALLLRDEGRSFIFLYAFLHFFINLQRRSRISHIYAGLNLANRVKVLSENRPHSPPERSRPRDESLQKGLGLYGVLFGKLLEVYVISGCRALYLNSWWQHGQGVCEMPLSGCWKSLRDSVCVVQREEETNRLCTN